MNPEGFIETLPHGKRASEDRNGFDWAFEWVFKGDRLRPVFGKLRVLLDIGLLFNNKE
jgi:hypothetical protein